MSALQLSAAIDRAECALKDDGDRWCGSSRQG